MIDWLRTVPRDPSVTIGGLEVPLAIRRHARAKRMTMRLAPDGSEVRITLPRWGRTADALVFVRNRTDWLERQLAAVPRAAPPAPGGTLAFRGETLAIAWDSHAPRRPVRAGTTLRVGGPQDTLASRIQRWLEAQALEVAAQDLEFYCGRARFGVPRLRLSRALRRWGSCSQPKQPAAGGAADAHARCIRINWRLIQAPDAVRRSVVAHEVAHLMHFDHSPAFHAALAELFEGDLAQCDDWLRREGRTLYRAFG